MRINGYVGSGKHDADELKSEWDLRNEGALFSFINCKGKTELYAYIYLITEKRNIQISSKNKHIAETDLIYVMLL